MLSTLRRSLSCAEAVLSARACATSTAKSHGALQDKDRIFTNIYGKHDIFIDGAMKRGDWHRCAPAPRHIRVGHVAGAQAVLGARTTPPRQPCRRARRTEILVRAWRTADRRTARAGPRIW